MHHKHHYITSGVIILLSFLTQSLLALPFVNDPSLVVQTKYGYLVGTYGETRLGRTILMFRGIPYAEPPVGDLRFEPPREPKSWMGIRDATTFGNICLQQIGGSEDCLFCNVYTPLRLPVNMGRGLPVIFFIHGGTFKLDSSDTYGPRYLLDEDCVLVTINYRLHAFGFLDTGDGRIKGNMGLKDQIAALRWVRENIANFGGDPNRVTIFGESAGAASVSYLMLSPLAKGLFDRAICHSGTAINPWALQTRPANRARMLADAIGCPTNDSAAMVDCLKKANATKITQYSTRGLIVEGFFIPSVEIERDGAVIPEHPYDVLTSGGAARIPWINGINSGEGQIVSLSIVLDPVLVAKIDSNWSAEAPNLLFYDPDRTNVTSAIDQFYFGTDDVEFYRYFDPLTILFSDRYFLSPARAASLIQAYFSNVFMFYNDYQLIPDNKGVIHFEDLLFFFDILGFSSIERLSPDYNMSASLVKLYVQFASGSSNLSLYNVPWGLVNSGEPGTTAYLEWSKNGTRMIFDVNEKRMKFWDYINLYRRDPESAIPDID